MSKNTERVQCSVCGKEFDPYRKTQKFCSVHCAVRGRGGPNKRSTTKQYNTQCQECGRLIYRKPFLLKKSEYHYCSKACLQLAQGVLFLGENNPNYKAAGKRKCIGCGKEYISYINTRKYCSQKCSGAAQQNEVMANLKRGYNAELRCGKELRGRGYHTTLSAASRGEYDVIAINKNEILLIQVKYTKNGRGPTPRARRKLKAAIAPTNKIVKKQLWTWVDRKGWLVE